MNRNTVDQVYYRAKKKLGKERVQQHKNFVNGLATSDTSMLLELIKNKLSQREMEVFLFMKMGVQEPNQILGLSSNSIGKIRNRIKKKLGIDNYNKFLNPKLKIEGIYPVTELSSGNKKMNCKHLLGIIDNREKGVICTVKGLNWKCNEESKCSSYSPHNQNNKRSGKKALEEELKDKGYIRMLYDVEVKGKQPRGQIEKTIYSREGIGSSKNYKKRRKEADKIIAKGARHYTINISEQEMTEDIREVLSLLNLRAEKIDYDTDENENEYKTYHYIIENSQKLDMLVKTLIGAPIISLTEEGKLQIQFKTPPPSFTVTLLKKDKHLIGTEVEEAKSECIINYVPDPGEYIINIQIKEAAVMFKILLVVEESDNGVPVIKTNIIE